MKKTAIYSITLLLIILLSTNIQAQLDPNVRDLRILSEWFEGEFDNDSQIWFDGRMKLDESERHIRMHASHIRIDAPEIGEYTFYVEEYIHDDPDSISRQRIVSFESVPDSSFIVMNLYFLKNTKKFLLKDNMNKFDHTIAHDDLFGLSECNVIFTRQGEQYHGSMRDKTCQFGKGNLRRYSAHNMIISKNQYWRVDQTYLVSNGKLHKGHPNDVPHKMRKVKYYSCDVSFYEKAYYLPSDKDKKYVNELIHDQGGSKWFYNPINDKRYLLQLRSKEYPFYKEGSDFFMMRLKEEEKLASDVIVTSVPNIKKLSFQIGWAMGNCTMVESSN